MKVQHVGIMSPGDMGQAVAQQIKGKGYNVYTALEKRSARTKALAREAGITDLGSIARLCEQCDVILSVMNPGAAAGFAEELAQALQAHRRKILFVECNAIAPGTMHEIDRKITAAGGHCVDGGIIGGPPRGTGKMRLYVSGSEAAQVEQFSTPQMQVRVLSERIGNASSLKMCYAAMTKGTTALVLELLVVARRLGVDAALENEFIQSQGAIYERILGQLPAVMPKAYRWVPEMQQIAHTFQSAGMTPQMFEGAASLYGYVAATGLGKETPENRDKSRTGKDVVNVLAEEGKN